MKKCLLNFKAAFAPAIENGTKPHTIRALRVDGQDPLPGDMLQLYTGLRTKAAKLLRSEACAYTHDITIQQSAGNVHHILLGGLPMAQSDITQLALHDGFFSPEEFVRFFDKTYGLPFTGVLIGWSPTPVAITRH